MAEEQIQQGTETATLDSVTDDKGAQQHQPDGGEGQPQGQQQQQAAPKKTPEEIEKIKERAAKRWDKALRERAELRGRLRAYEEIYGPMNPDGTPRNAQRQAPQPPKREEFATDEEYQEAKIDWKVEQRVAKSHQELEQRFSQTQTRQIATSSFAKQEAAARIAHEDYDEVVSENADVPIPQGCSDAILDSDVGAEIKYYLAKHPEEAYNLGTMPEYAAIKKIGAIENKILSKMEGKKKPSGAPDPINPPAASGAPDTLDHLKEEDAKKMPFDEWRRRERERIKKMKGK